ncbi:MAG: filamentous hemagglutinin N-terminal domain-containing protein, partial [Thiotrichales bacterium]|nr:filamentous hemagglutinin N-terminal domain-containing protein [Thiotrichales bacterium]
MDIFRNFALFRACGSCRSRSSAATRPVFPGTPVSRFVFTLSLFLGCHTGNVIAGPEGGEVVGGQGTISSPNAATTQINQTTQNLAIEWQTYNVGANELVEYIQPNRSATALNKIFDANPSQIFGTIKANGQIILVNPNGVFFKPGATVSVGSLVASGVDISSQDFMNGNYTFNAPDGSSGMVINQGVLQAATGGSINLVGRAVKNEGLILAHAGQVNMVAGDKITMDFDGDGLMQFVIDKEVLENVQDLDDAIRNDGTIDAEGGSVLLTAKA